MKFEGVSLKKNFWRFIWPTVVAQWIFSLYTMVDGMFVARGVSETALSAVNIAMPFMNFLFSVSILFAVGTSTVVSIYLGQGKRKEANQAYSQSILALVIVSLIIMLGVWFGLDQIASFLGSTTVTHHFVRQYILSLLPFSWCFTISYSLEILIKTDGYPRFAAIAVTSGAILNCILDYLFVMVFRWGITGAGVATGISQFVVLLLYLAHFLSPRATIRFEKPLLNLAQIWRIIRNGLSSGLTEASAGITVFMFNHAILATIGDQGIISYTIIAYVNTIVVMSMAGVAQGAQPLISYYYGKGDHGTYKKLLKYSVMAIMILAVTAFAGTLIGGKQLVALFISRDLIELTDYTVSAFRIFGISFLFMGANIVASGYFTAVERPKSALAISLGRGVVTVALSLIICITLIGGAGIWWAPTMSEVLCLLMTAVLTWQYYVTSQKKRAPQSLLVQN